jgi:ATP-dependent RNA helicase SUPV3L1/SUV3
MTSLAGCSGEDFASILRSLGYRLDRRPPLPQPAAPAEPAPVAADPAEPETAPALAPDTLTPGEVDAATPVDAPVPVTSESAPSAPIELGLGGVDPVQSTASETPAAPAAPALVDVWRPGRLEGARRPPRRPKHARREPRAGAADATGAQPAPAVADATAAPDEQARARRRGRDGPRRKERRFDRIGVEHQPERSDPERKPRGEHPRTERPRHARPRAEARDRPVDPNSPFAALLELKAKLEADQKEKG